jgi:S1-C subfamily serine protease
MTSNQIRAIILAVAIGLGVTIRFVWKGYKIARSANGISSNSGEDHRIRIPQPASLPTNPTAYSPKREPVVVKFTPIQPPDKLLKHLSPSVVRIMAIDAKGEPIGQGSGFIVAQAGLIVTNYHVVKGANSLALYYENGHKLEVEGIAASDPDGDLALIKVKGALPGALPLAGPDLPTVNSTVYAIGYPLGVNNVISDGTVTGLRKDAAGVMLIQTSVTISPGCSGGPLLNEDGKVLGVATNYGQNRSFAIERARIVKLIETYKGGAVTAASKQQWVANNVEREQINLWLAKASAEAPKMLADRSRVCSWIAEGYARTGDRAGLGKILQFVDSGESAWQQQATNLGLQARAGDADAATATLEMSSNQRLRLHGHLAIANALRERGDIPGFIKHMEAATELAKTQRDPIVRGDWLVMVIKACADAGQFETAAAGVELLRDTDDPTLDSRAAATTGVKRNFKSAALAYFGIGKSRAGDHAGAEAIADGIFDETDKAFLFESIAEFRARGNDAAGAFTTAQRIKVGYMKNKAMLEAAEAFARQGDRNKVRDALGEALGAAQTIKETWRKAEADSRLVSTIALCGDFATAEKKAGEFPDETGRSAANGSIAVAWARHGDFKQMATSLAKVKDPWAAQAALVECAILQAKSGHLRAASITVSRIANVDTQVETTRAIVKATAGRLPAQMILETASKFTLPEQKAAAYLGLAEGLLDREQAAAAAASAKVRTDE